MYVSSIEKENKKSVELNWIESMILQDHRRLPVCLFRVKIAAVGSLKRLTGRKFVISQKFHGRQADENFFSTTSNQTILKTISEYLEIDVQLNYSFHYPMSTYKTRTFLDCLLWDIFSLYIGYDSYAAPIGANAAWGADKAAPASGSGHGWALFYNTFQYCVLRCAPTSQ
jgi:hypothetical protein